MAHPMRNEAREGHNAKMRRMTTHYGSAAGPSENILGETDRMKGEGPEDNVGFGADAAAPRARADRPARKTMAANPLATYKAGGHVKKRADGGATEDSISSEMSRKAAADRTRNATIHRAKGGRAKHKGTHVNIMIGHPGGPGAGAGAPPVPPPVIAPPGAGAPPPLPPRPPMPPMGAAPPMGGPGPIGPIPPGLPPPGMMAPRKKGGRVHSDEAADRKLFHKMMAEHEKGEMAMEAKKARADGGAVGESLRGQGLTRSDKAQDMGLKGRARGGKIIGEDSKVNWGAVPSHMTAGAISGEGRLEKIKVHRKSGDMKPQAV